MAAHRPRPSATGKEPGAEERTFLHLPVIFLAVSIPITDTSPGTGSRAEPR
jgi:hypothetical protein